MALNASYSNSYYAFYTGKTTRIMKNPKYQIFLMRARVTSSHQGKDVYKLIDGKIYVFKRESYCYPEYLITISYNYYWL